MIAKIYALVWVLFVASAGIVYLTRGFTEVGWTIIGFVLSTLLFAGGVAVLPWWVDRQFAWKG